jgi:hypothetical protein
MARGEKMICKSECEYPIRISNLLVMTWQGVFGILILDTGGIA